MGISDNRITATRSLFRSRGVLMGRL